MKNPLFRRMSIYVCISLAIITIITTILEVLRAKGYLPNGNNVTPNGEVLILRAIFIHLIQVTIGTVHLFYAANKIVSKKKISLLYTIHIFLLFISWFSYVLEFFDPSKVQHLELSVGYIGFISLPLFFIIMYIFSAIQLDIVDRLVREQKLSKYLKNISFIDGLTMIPNRRFFDLKIQNEHKKMIEGISRFSLVLLDIDYFKLYNDQYGHLQGDECLKQVGRFLVVHLKGKGVVCRYGGEEFGFILPNCSKEEALEIARNCNKSLEDLAIPHLTSPISDYVTCSAGVVTFEIEEKISIKQGIETADQRLYMAKQNGRNRVVG
ncbi:GGDEF domain-containing protein [Mangrovibacillus cuniculi]|uniref:GGDEF domain-containing protein n=1 Tax=Mangrovibacillus cuniculi TaxID=2593652 RepID=A0A7S8HH40_9BACI|nr:diguanylate cyclase [Mangrovibacillus cuniculi]QPC48246.1 GGDEF domain-containing protein [Mangrovibacillus cuniculi]